MEHSLGTWLALLRLAFSFFGRPLSRGRAVLQWTQEPGGVCAGGVLSAACGVRAAVAKGVCIAGEPA